MSSKPMLSRRTMLRGLGASIALPMLDAMLPAGGLARAARAASGLAGAAGSAATAVAAPVRMAMLFTPNGMWMPDFTPDRRGARLRLAAHPRPARRTSRRTSTSSAAWPSRTPAAMGDGGGDHARSAAAFLTGVHPYKTSRQGHPPRHLRRPGGRRADRQQDPLAVAGAGPRQGPDRRPVRLRLQLRLRHQHLLARRAARRCPRRSTPAPSSTACSARRTTAPPARARPSG